MKGLYSDLRVVIAGTLVGYTHAELFARPMMRGAIPQKKLSKRTQLLILGEDERWVHCAAHRARWTAEGLNRAGASIRILTFDELLAEHYNASDAAAKKAKRAAKGSAKQAAAAWESLTTETSWPAGPNAFPVQL